LIEPAPTASTPTYRGDSWVGFDEARIVAVAPASPVEAFTLVDVATEETYEQPTGSPVGELVLAADGLGVARFGQPREEVVAAIGRLVGEPEEVEANEVEGIDPDGSVIVLYRWGHLTVAFHEGAITNERTRARGFTEYFFSRAIDPSVNLPVPWDPQPWEVALATPEGVGLRTPRAEAEAAYPVAHRQGNLRPVEAQFDGCDESLVRQAGLGITLPRESGPRRSIAPLLYLNAQPHGLYLGPMIDGGLDEVTRIGANARWSLSVLCATSSREVSLEAAVG
jgi:hypothetical protein